MRHEFHSAHPAERVLLAYANGVPRFGGGLPAVQEVVVVTEHEEAGELHRVHLWRADTRTFPYFLTRWIDPRLFEWTTTCRWNPEELVGSWELEIGVFGEGTHIRGSHRFLSHGKGCLVQVEGEVLLEATRFATLAGMPVVRPVQRALDSLVERVFHEIVVKSGAVVEASLDSS